MAELSGPELSEPELGGPESGGPRYRLGLLESLYGAEIAQSVAPRLEAMIAASRRHSARSPLWDQSDTWVISYPDQFRRPGEVPLAGLRSFFDRHLHPVFNGVHLLPFHPWSSDRGFSVIDPLAVNPEYGTWTDIDLLASDARLMADAVVNHLSVESPWFSDFLRRRPGSEHLFRTVEPGADLTTVVRPRTSPPTTEFLRPDGSRVTVWTTFSPDQADLDYRHPEVLLRIIAVLLNYLDHGARAIRLDAVAFLWKQEGTPSIHLPQTHTIVSIFRSVLAAVDPSVILVTETNVPHRENISYFGPPERPEAHAVYQFALPPLVLHALLTGSAGPLREWAASVTPERPDTTFLNFLASHDGVGLRPVEDLLPRTEIDNIISMCEAVGGRVNSRAGEDGEPVPYELGGTWMSLIGAGAPQFALRRHLASHAIAFSLRGIPLVYAHSLLGSLNDTAAYMRTGQPRDLNRATVELAEIERSLLKADSVPSRVLNGLKIQLRARAARPAFHPNSDQRILADHDAVFGVERTSAEGCRSLVLVNVTDSPTEFRLPSDGKWTLAGHREISPSVVTIGPYGYRCLDDLCDTDSPDEAHGADNADGADG